jgi:CheY-like chemotaxis protein
MNLIYEPAWSTVMADNLTDSVSSPATHVVAKVILIVEDDAAFAQFLCDAISSETPHQPVHVNDSTQALRIIKEVTPDLIILDYHLPNMNGIDLYDLLHSQKELEHVPTIMTTAGVLEHDFQDRHIVGISKPVSLTKLLDIVAELID